MRAKGVLVVNLAPLPRYQGPCCVVQSHGLHGGDSPGTLSTLLRDVCVYMGRTGLLNHPDQLEVVISPMDAVGPSAFLHSHISKDNVHPKLEFLNAFACAILFVRRKSQTLMPAGVRGIPFSSLHLRQLERREFGSGALPVITPRPSVPSVFPTLLSVTNTSMNNMSTFSIESDILHIYRIIIGFSVKLHLPYRC